MEMAKYRESVADDDDFKPADSAEFVIDTNRRHWQLLFSLRANRQKPYMEMDLQCGSGKRRLGTILNLEEGIYPLLFISNFKRIYIQKALEMNGETEEADQKQETTQQVSINTDMENKQPLMGRMEEGMVQKLSRRESIKKSNATDFLGIQRKKEKIHVGKDRDGKDVFEVH